MTEEKKKPKPPKGGRKGGAVFPRVSLKQANGWARKLVVKTHTTAQPVEVIYSGVVGHKGGQGNVRISALKQFGYLEGDRKSGYKAADLAKKLVATTPEELVGNYQLAALKPKLFKQLFDTFIGDTVSVAKLRQRALDLNVHPEEADSCVANYVETLAMAELVTVAGEQVAHVSPSAISGTQGGEPKQQVDESATTIEDEQDPAASGSSTAESSTGNQADTPDPNAVQRARAAKAIITVNVTLDSSLDTDKLAKQLELLKKYGAI